MQSFFSTENTDEQPKQRSTTVKYLLDKNIIDSNSYIAIETAAVEVITHIKKSTSIQEKSESFHNLLPKISFTLKEKMEESFKDTLPSGFFLDLFLITDRRNSLMDLSKLEETWTDKINSEMKSFFKESTLLDQENPLIQAFAACIRDAIKYINMTSNQPKNSMEQLEDWPASEKYLLDEGIIDLNSYAAIETAAAEVIAHIKESTLILADGMEKSFKDNLPSEFLIDLFLIIGKKDSPTRLIKLEETWTDKINFKMKSLFKESTMLDQENPLIQAFAACIRNAIEYTNMKEAQAHTNLNHQ